MLIRVPGLPYAVNSDKVISVGILPSGELAICLEGLDAQVEFGFAEEGEAEEAMDDIISQFNAS
jgi:hypothetical protein